MAGKTAELASRAQQAARTGDVDELDGCIAMIAYLHRIGTHKALDMTTDEVTGDTILHVAATHGQIGIISQIGKTCFSRRAPRSDSGQRAYTIRRNKTEGNTALHCAVVQDNLDVVRAIYRFFMEDWLPGEDSFGEPPIEDATDIEDEECFAPPLVFLRMKNKAGRDAAAQARAAGREENAKWCEEVVGRLDPRDEHQTPEELERLGEYV